MEVDSSTRRVRDAQLIKGSKLTIDFLLVSRRLEIDSSSWAEQDGVNNGRPCCPLSICTHLLFTFNVDESEGHRESARRPTRKRRPITPNKVFGLMPFLIGAGYI